jgi:adenylate cyclase
VRITAQLIDATTDIHVWSESYERDLSPANVFEIQSDIARQIANALEVQLLDREGQRQPASPTAWDLYMRARYLFRRESNPERLLESRRLLERAVELDPGFAPAHAGLAVSYATKYRYSLQRDTELLGRAETYARRSLALDPQDHQGHLVLGLIFEFRGKPTDAIREAILGQSQMKLGRLGEAKRSFERVQQLNPRTSAAFFWAARGTLHYLEGEFEQAVELWERARTMRSLIGNDRIMLVRYYESAGRHEDAQTIVQEMLSAQPEITAERGVEILARFWNEEWIPEDLEENLRSAGLP